MSSSVLLESIPSWDWKAFYDNSPISNTIAKEIFIRAFLIRVFNNSANNNKITIIPTFQFSDSEKETLQVAQTPQAWAITFINLCKNSYYASDCLNTLCNLHQYDCKNYQLHIVRILTTTVNVEVRKVVKDTLLDIKTETSHSKITNRNRRIEKLAATMRNNKGVVAFIILCFLVLLGIGITYAAPVVTGTFNDHGIKNSSTQDDSTEHAEIPRAPDSTPSLVPEKIHSVVQAVLVEPQLSEMPVNANTEIEVKSSTENSILKKQNGGNLTKNDMQQRVYIRRPGDIGEKRLQLCDPQFKTNLVFDSVDSFDPWGIVHVDCGARIHSLDIKGYLRPLDMLTLVNQTRNIRHLAIIGNDLCTASQGLLAMIDAFPKIYLLHLRSLVIKGMTDKDSGCREVLTLIANKFRFSSKLKTLTLEDVTFDTKNKNELHRIVYNLRFDLKELYMRSIDFRVPAFDLNFPDLNLTRLHLFAQNTSSSLASQSIKNLLSKENLSTKEFHSNIEIPDAIMSSTLRNFRKLGVSNLNFSISLKSTRTELSLQFLRALRRLTHCEIRLAMNEGTTSLILKDFSSLRTTLNEFRVTAKFKFKDIGANDVPCRGYEKATSDEGIIALTLDRCPNCVKSGCSRR